MVEINHILRNVKSLAIENQSDHTACSLRTKSFFGKSHSMSPLFLPVLLCSLEGPDNELLVKLTTHINNSPVLTWPSKQFHVFFGMNPQNFIETRKALPLPGACAVLP